MKCHTCSSKSFQHSMILYMCFRCDTHIKTHHEPIDQCPKCNKSDLCEIFKQNYECLSCGDIKGLITKYSDANIKSMIHNIAWRGMYPIDSEELCKEAFKPERVMYQLSLCSDYNM